MGDPLVAELAAAGMATSAEASLAVLTTLRVGGPARALVTAERDDDLAAVGRICLRHGVPWLVVGRGSNLLVSDAGFPGVAIRLGRTYRNVVIDGGRVIAGAAAPLPSVASLAAKAGLGGLAWMTAVPGCVGGAVRMNAGAHGGETRDTVVEADVVRLSTGGRETFTRDQLGFTYRHSDLPADGVVVSATFDLQPADADRIRQEMEEIRRWRREHQPLNEPNCGSVFTNPPDDSAGRLIEAAGCKGLTVGGASVSVRHANFIVTRPGATAHDVVTLIHRVQEQVMAHAGVPLSTEVVAVGGLEHES